MRPKIRITYSLLLMAVIVQTGRWILVCDVNMENEMNDDATIDDVTIEEQTNESEW